MDRIGWSDTLVLMSSSAKVSCRIMVKSIPIVAESSRKCSGFMVWSSRIPNMRYAKECNVRKYGKSSFATKLNRSAARSRASWAALRVKARKAIWCDGTPSARALSTMFSKVVVFPVPGGPKILNIRKSPRHVIWINTKDCDNRRERGRVRCAFEL